MDTNEINHRRCILFRGHVVRRLVQELADRQPCDLVSDVASEMHAELAGVGKRLASVDRVQHDARQYMACNACRKPITILDVELNECAHCGAQVYTKKG